MSITVRLDYATVNFVPGSMSYTKVGKILLGDGASMFWKPRGLSENAPLYSPLGLRWMENNGYSEMPHKLEISGVGCTHFMPVLPELVKDVDHRFSRLDFAFDVLVSRSDWRKFICKAFESSLCSDRKYKAYRLSGQGEAMTIYIGSRSCAKFFRIYNKTLQDPKYQFVQDGQIVEVPEDMCVIRYEVELKRHVVTAKDGQRIYDPSPAFEWYYGDEEAQHRLCEVVRELWLSFGDDVLLPQGFENAELQTIIHNENFVAKDAKEKLQEVREKLHDYPRSFEHTIAYVVSHFGKYIPYIVSDADYMRDCETACTVEFGFVPQYYLEQTAPQGFYDLDNESIPVDGPSSIPWAFEQLELSQLEITESEVEKE